MSADKHSENTITERESCTHKVSGSHSFSTIRWKEEIRHGYKEIDPVCIGCAH